MRQILDYIFINDKIIYRQNAQIPVFDNGFLYGHGVFTTIKVKEGYPLFLNYHIRRLQSNTKTITIPFPTNIEQAILSTITKNNLTNGGIRLTITPSTFAIHAFTLPSHSSHLEKISVITLPDTRDIYKTIKTTYRVPHLLALKKAKMQNSQDTIFTKNNQLIESTNSNIFKLSNNGTIITPPIKNKGLNGITRQILMTKIPIQEKPISHNTTAPIILTNCLRLRAVTNINNTQLKQNPEFYNLILTTIQNAEKSYIENEKNRRIN